MIITLTKTEMLIVNELEPGKIIMKGARSIMNRMLRLNLKDSMLTVNHSKRQLKSVCQLQQKDVIYFISQSMWNPVTDN